MRVCAPAAACLFRSPETKQSRVGQVPRRPAARGRANQAAGRGVGGGHGWWAWACACARACARVRMCWRVGGRLCGCACMWDPLWGAETFLLSDALSPAPPRSVHWQSGEAREAKDGTPREFAAAVSEGLVTMQSLVWADGSPRWVAPPRRFVLVLPTRFGFTVPGHSRPK